MLGCLQESWWLGNSCCWTDNSFWPMFPLCFIQRAIQQRAAGSRKETLCALLTPSSWCHHRIISALGSKHTSFSSFGFTDILILQQMQHIRPSQLLQWFLLHTNGPTSPADHSSTCRVRSEEMLCSTSNMLKSTWRNNGSHMPSSQGACWDRHYTVKTLLHERLDDRKQLTTRSQAQDCRSQT